MGSAGVTPAVLGVTPSRPSAVTRCLLARGTLARATGTVALPTAEDVGFGKAHPANDDDVIIRNEATG
jgi:hypothetical protein